MVRKSQEMPSDRIGAPPLQPKYDFAAHLEHLGMVLPHRRPSNRDLHECCTPSMKHIGIRQFMQQLRGLANHHPLLPVLLHERIPLPEFGVTVDHWRNFDAFKRAVSKEKAAAIPGTPELLRGLLEEWHKASRMPKLVLVAERQRRWMGRDDPNVPRLEGGPHRLHYHTGAANGATAYLLLLEYDEHRNEWACANRVEGIDLDVEKPVRAEGSLPVPIMSSPGLFSVFAIAGPVAFDDGIVALVESEAIGPDGAMSAEVVDGMIEALKAEPLPARRVGRFRYRVS